VKPDRAADADHDHYSYAAYADPAMAQSFDKRRFSGPIGELVAKTQARVLANMVGRIQNRKMLDVGTGTGRAALILAAGGAKVTAVDASEEMLAIARQRAAEQMTAGPAGYGEIHHLGREYERSHHTQQRDAVILRIALRAAGYPCDRGGADHVQCGPYGRTQKSVGDMHRNRFLQ